MDHIDTRLESRVILAEIKSWTTVETPYWVTTRHHLRFHHVQIKTAAGIAIITLFSS